MGRKIPGKKHRGTKDPLKQQAKRLAELGTKINAPPKDSDEQPVPKSLERVIKLKEAVKSGKIGKVKKKKKKKKNALVCVGVQNPKPKHPKARPDKVVPVFQQKPGESAHHFLYRVSQDTQAFIKETSYEKKYNIEIKRDPQTGKIEGFSKFSKKELSVIEKLRTQHRDILKQNSIKQRKKKKDKDENKNKKKDKDKDKPVAPKKLTKAQKKKQKEERKNLAKQQENQNDFQFLKDEIKFGEVAHEPPHLRTRPKGAPAKPSKKGLLLNSLLDKQETGQPNPKTVKKEVVNGKVNKRGKRKKLPIGERRQLDQQQKNIIAAYRKMKRKKVS